MKRSSSLNDDDIHTIRYMITPFGIYDKHGIIKVFVQRKFTFDEKKHFHEFFFYNVYKC